MKSCVIEQVEESQMEETNFYESMESKQESVSPKLEKIEVENKLEEKQTQEKSLEEQKEILEKAVNNDNLHIHRMDHYQNYMREKVKKSELGELSFSAYLEKVAPYLTELIEIEKTRESLAKTIYKDYLKYYALLKDKNSSLSFEEFAEKRYGVENIDVPMEYDEEYKGMMKK